MKQWPRYHTQRRLDGKNQRIRKANLRETKIGPQDVQIYREPDLLLHDFNFTKVEPAFYTSVTLLIIIA